MHTGEWEGFRESQGTRMKRNFFQKTKTIIHILRDMTGNHIYRIRVE